MKKAIIALLGLGILMSCNTKQDESGYVGPAEITIADGVMTPETLLSLGRLSDPQLSPDGSKILYGVSYTSIQDNRSCRNLFLCNPDGSGRVQLTRYAKSVGNARWSPDGKEIWFVQGGQIWKAPFLGSKLGKKVKVSDIPAGVGEFKLSPDGQQILYTSTIKNPALVQPSDTDPALDKARAYATEDLMYRHWDHWVTEIPRTYVATTVNGTITPDRSLDLLGEDLFELPTEPFGGIEQLDWAPDNRHIAYSCRKKTGKEYAFSTDTDIYIYDILTGATVPVTKGGGYDTDPVWSPDGKRLAWISMARDGYEADQQRLMVADIGFGAQPGDGQSADVQVKNVRDLTADFDRDAAGICWAPGGKAIFFNALMDGVQALFFVNAVDEPKVSRITPTIWTYDFDSPFAVRDSEKGLELLTSACSLNLPTELFTIHLSGTGPAVGQITNENGHILDQLARPDFESVWIETVDHQQMQCWVLYPPDFNLEKVYPAIEIVLGGPQGTNSQNWSYRWCYRLMAQQGYIVIMPNRRGTTAFGQAWKEEISGDYCGLNMQDYLSAGRYFKSKPYVGKLACVGASYGGYSAYMLEGLHGDLYDCFIAHAGIFDEKQLWYTTEEMWFANWDNGGLTEYAYTPGKQGPEGDGITFGGMQQAGAPYATTPKAQRHYANSPSSMVTKWHTPILCIHGMMDYRIPYEQGMAAFNAAQMMGVPSKLLIFPDENHWILQPQNALFWHRNFYDWLDKWLKQ